MRAFAATELIRLSIRFIKIFPVRTVGRHFQQKSILVKLFLMLILHSSANLLLKREIQALASIQTASFVPDKLEQLPVLHLLCII